MQTAAAFDQGLKFASAGRHFEAIECFEQALAASPSDSRILFALGNTARALGQSAIARQFFAQVLALEPGRIEALVNLANLMRLDGQFDMACALLEPALEKNPGRPELHLTMGSAASESGDNDRAAWHYHAALAIHPDYAPALSNLADLLADAGDYDGARLQYDRALKSEPGNAQTRVNRAVLNLLTGNLKEGWRDYAARTSVAGKTLATELRLKEWNGDTLKKTRLLVRAEQGVGDQIMFASLFGELAARAADDGGSVILECDRRLVPLFARSYPDATVHAAEWKNSGGQVTAEYGWLKGAGGANAVILAGSLPRLLRKSLDAFPAGHAYLKPGLGEQVRWHGVFAGFGPSPLIGLSWRSGKSGGLRNVQYAPLAAWANFVKDLPGTLVSAQYDASPEEVALLSSLSGREIFVPQGLDQKNELDRTCAMLAALDVLVSAPTAVSWLGAAAGVRTLKMLYAKSWTCFGENHEPLAPSCVCVTPGTRGDWSDAFSRATALIAQI
jgi:Flp pilus assembly protein TadD